MNRATYEEVLDQLEEQGELDAETRRRVEEEVRAEFDAQPSRLLSAVAGVGALLSTFFGLVFIAAVTDSSVAIGITALILLGTALAIDAMSKRATHLAVASPVVLALSFSAQVAMFIALFDLMPSDGAATATSVAFSGVTYALLGNVANRVVSALIVAVLAARYLEVLEPTTYEPALGGVPSVLSIQFFFFVAYLTCLVAIPALVFGARQWCSVRVGRILRPAAYVAAVMASIATGEWVTEAFIGPFAAAQTVIVVVTAGALVAIAYVEQRRDTREWWPLAMLAGLVIVGILTHAGLIWAAVLVGLGIWRRRLPLVVVGWITLAVHLFVFLSELHFSPLVQSLSLIGGGSVFLGLWWILREQADAIAENSIANRLHLH